MAILQILPSPLFPCFRSLPRTHMIPKSSIDGDNTISAPPKPARRSRKKPTTPTKKSQTEPNKIENEEQQLPDDEIDFPYDYPPLICCFGAAQKEFVPSVRVSDQQMHPDMYSEWKMLQWDPPEFARAPGGPPSNVAIAHVRLGGRAAFMGKVGDDEFGHELVMMMNKENVQTRGVKIDGNEITGCAFVKIVFDGKGKMKGEIVKEAAEDSLLSSELNLSVLKEVLFGLFWYS